MSKDKESGEDSEAKKRADLRKKLFGGDEEEAKSEDAADTESPVAKDNKKLEKPKKSLKEDDDSSAKSASDTPKPTKSKIKKRTHREVDFEDTTHDLFRGDEKEKNTDKMGEFDK